MCSSGGVNQKSATDTIFQTLTGLWNAVSFIISFFINTVVKMQVSLNKLCSDASREGMLSAELLGFQFIISLCDSEGLEVPMLKATGLNLDPLLKPGFYEPTPLFQRELDLT